MKRISQIAPEVIELSEKCIKNNNIDPAHIKNMTLNVVSETSMEMVF